MDGAKGTLNVFLVSTLVGCGATTMYTPERSFPHIDDCKIHDKSPVISLVCFGAVFQIPCNATTRQCCMAPPKAKSSGKKTDPPASTARAVAPNWPPLQPLLSSLDLSLSTTLIDQILTIPQFWTSTLCKTYVAFLSTLPLVTTPGKPKKGNAVRVNDRYQIDDSRFAEQLWSSSSLKELVTNPVIDGVALDEDQKRQLWGGEVLGLNSNIRIYRYTKGQFFDQHCQFGYFP